MSKLRKNYKYSASFSCEVTSIVKDSNKPKISKASLDRLRKIIPEEILASDNPDILNIAFNGAVVGLANRNGDLITKDTALQVYKKFKFKPINKDHIATDIVGVITNAGFSEFGTDEIYGTDDLNDKDLFNLTLSGIIYELIDGDLAAALEDCSDPSSANYKQISASWELLFNDYDIMVGSPEITNAVVKTRAEEDFVKYDSMLKCNGGKGMDESGNGIYRILKGNVLPVGIGLTPNPAAFVEGIYAECGDKPKEEHREDMEDEDREDAVVKSEIVISAIINEDQINSMTEKAKEIVINEIKKGHGLIDKLAQLDETSNEAAAKLSISIDNLQHSNNEGVSNFTTNISNMHITNLDELKKALATEATKPELASSIASLFEEMQNKMAQESEKWLAEKKAQEDLVLAEKANAEKVAKELSELKASFEKANEELNKIKEDQAQALAQEAYNTRMAEFDAEFDLDDDDRQILADDLKGMTDETYAAYKGKMSKLMKGKKKGMKSECNTVASTVAVASVDSTEAVVEQAVAAATVTDKNDVVVSAPVTESVADRWGKTFSATIDGREIKLK